MKKCFIVLLLIHILFESCKQDPDKKAKSLIKDKLYNSLHDFKSYEPVSYGKLDSNYSSLEDDEDYVGFKKYYDSLMSEIQQNIVRAKEYPVSSYYDAQVAKGYLDKAKKIVAVCEPMSYLIDSTTNNFKSHFVGWKMRHTYRAKNLAGNLGIHHTTFFFNDSLTVVTKFRDQDQN